MRVTLRILGQNILEITTGTTDDTTTGMDPEDGPFAVAGELRDAPTLDDDATEPRHRIIWEDGIGFQA